MHNYSTYAHAIRHIFEMEAEAIQQNQEQGLPQPLVWMAFHAGGNNRMQNAPVHGNQVAAFVINPDGAPPPSQVVMESHHGGLKKKISIEDPNLDPMILALIRAGNTVVQTLPNTETE